MFTNISDHFGVRPKRIIISKGWLFSRTAAGGPRISRPGTPECAISSRANRPCERSGPVAPAAPAARRHQPLRPSSRRCRGSRREGRTFGAATARAGAAPRGIPLADASVSGVPWRGARHDRRPPQGKGLRRACGGSPRLDRCAKLGSVCIGNFGSSRDCRACDRKRPISRHSRQMFGKAVRIGCHFERDAMLVAQVD